MLYWSKKWFCFKSKYMMFHKLLFFYRFLVAMTLDFIALFLPFGFSFYAFLLFCSCFTSSCCFEKLACVFWLLFHVLFFVLFDCFVRGLEGQVRWPEGPPATSLGPKPSLLCFGFVLFCFLLFVVWRVQGSSEVAYCYFHLIYIYIYICCGVVIWSKFGGFKCYYLVQVCFFL